MTSLPITHGLPPAAASLLDLIEGHAARVGVVGAGYVGLPFLLEKAKVGFRVTAFDRNKARVKDILAGRSYIPDVEQAEFERVVRAGFVSATAGFESIGDCDVIVIC